MPRLLLTRLGESVMVCCANITAQIPGKQNLWQEKGRLQTSCILELQFMEYVQQIYRSKQGMSC